MHTNAYKCCGRSLCTKLSLIKRKGITPPLKTRWRCSSARTCRGLWFIQCGCSFCRVHAGEARGNDAKHCKARTAVESCQPPLKLAVENPCSCQTCDASKHASKHASKLAHTLTKPRTRLFALAMLWARAGPMPLASPVAFARLLVGVDHHAFATLPLSYPSSAHGVHAELRLASCHRGRQSGDCPGTMAKVSCCLRLKPAPA